MLKLILADNQAIFRAGIAKVLAVEDEMRIVAQAQTPEQMFMALDKFRAAVLVVGRSGPRAGFVRRGGRRAEERRGDHRRACVSRSVNMAGELKSTPQSSPR